MHVDKAGMNLSDVIKKNGPKICLVIGPYEMQPIAVILTCDWGQEGKKLEQAKEMVDHPIYCEACHFISLTSLIIVLFNTHIYIYMSIYIYIIFFFPEKMFSSSSLFIRL